MVRTEVLVSSLWVPTPPKEVFPFFADPRNLQELTPPWLKFQLVDPPATTEAGSQVEIRLKVHGIPMRWLTRITDWDPPRRFTDVQERGPYRQWIHTHTFTPARGGTVLGDRVAFQVRGGLLAPLISTLFVRRDVLRIFRYRIWRMAELFGGDPTTGTVQIETRSEPAGDLVAAQER